MTLNSLVLTCASASPLWLTILFSFFVPLAATGQQQEQQLWTWTNNKGDVRRQADLDKIVDRHKLWLNSNGESGARADLSDAHLRGAELRSTDLEHADLERADLSGANLGAAHLSDAELGGASLDNANLEHADLRGAHLTDVDLRQAELAYANLSKANLRGAHLEHANLNQADLNYADLTYAVLGGAHLEHANLSQADLNYADLSTADLGGAYFEPTNLPELLELARAHGLEEMTYQNTPGPLTQLRKQFQDVGFREQERAITCALNRAEADRDLPIERWFRWIAFDFTSRYGLSPGRPLRIVFWLWLFFSGVYAFFMHRPGPLGIYFVVIRRWRSRSGTRGVQIRPRSTRASKLWGFPFLRLGEEWRVLRAAMFFSIMSASNVGFREINFGQWLRMLTRYEYDLWAVGWARTISGFQSLVSVYLIALCVLTYFGRPFG